MEPDVYKYRDRSKCFSRRCSSNRPPQWEVCSTYACHFSADFQPSQTWKLYYRQQKLQEIGHRKRTFLNNLCRCYGNDFLQSALGDWTLMCPRLPDKHPPDFYVRPWQQQSAYTAQKQPCLTMAYRYF